MTNRTQQQAKRRGVYIAAGPDFDFLAPLERVANIVDRAPHILSGS